MAFLHFLIPPAYFGLSTVFFLIAAQLQFQHRLYLLPLVLGFAILSLSSSHHLAPLPSMNTLWGLLSCIWILHATSTLIIENRIIPTGSPKWISAYKIWNDPRRQVNLAHITSKRQVEEAQSPSTSTRAQFLIRRLAWILFISLLQFLIIGPFPVLYFRFKSQDFEPQNRIFIRRLLLLSPNLNSRLSITSREIQIRLFLSIYWIWITYLMLEICHCLLSIFFVVILRFDTPEEWPSLFGSPLQAYSIRRFWSRFWHRLTVPSCSSTGKLLARKYLGIKSDSIVERLFVAFWTFLLSAVYHFVADWQAGEPCYPANDFFFFLANFGLCVLEMVISPIIDRVLRREMGDSRVGYLLAWSKGRKLVGSLWVLGFFFWSVPKWQYAKFEEMFRHLES